jgi:signal transduction histidine kinase
MRAPAGEVQTDAMLRSLTWLIRGAAIIVIGVLTFGVAASGADLVAEATAFAISVAVLAYWLVTDIWPGSGGRHQPLVMATGLGAMAAASGGAAAGEHGGALIGLTFVAVLGAGVGDSLLAGGSTLAAAIVAIEVGVLITGLGVTQTLGYPLLLVVAFVGGRNRGAYRRQAEQSAALVAQLEQLRQEQRRVAVLDERTRIAREIHDVLAHSLGALGIQLQAVRAVLADQGDIGRGLGLLEQAQRMAREGLVDTRRAVHALRTDASGLDEQLTALVAAHRGRHQATVEFRVDGPPRPLPPEATVALLRTAQEALVNTAKHAPHQQVDVVLRYNDDGTEMIIRNDLPPAGAAAASPAPAFGTVNGGYGLTGMRERLLLIGGTLTAAPAGDQWAVTAQVPR